MNNTLNSVIGTKGVQATSFEETIKNADLDWDVQSAEITAKGSDIDITMPRKRILFRSDTQEALGIVGEDYQPSNPRQFLEFQYDIAAKIGGKVVQAGFIPDRARAFAFIHLDKSLVVPRKDAELNKDVVAAYIYSYDGWDGGTPRKSRLYLERLVCRNGMTSKEIKSSLWVSHTKNIDERYSPRKMTFEEEVVNTLEVMTGRFNTLSDRKMKLRDFDRFLGKLVPGESAMSEKRRAQIRQLFLAGEGNHGETRWDALNAITEYVTHHRPYRETESTSKETNRMLGVLETDTMVPKAMDLLLN